MAALTYPVFLVLEGRLCLVVGGGSVAARKVQELCRCGAAVTVISPVVTAALEQAAESGAIRLHGRAVEREDLRGAFLVVAATNDRAVNEWVAREAAQAGALVNVADAPESCSFFVPSTLRRGRLALAISTEGASPALAARLRRELAEIFGPEWGDVVEALRRFRQRLAGMFPAAPATRSRLLRRASVLPLDDLARKGGVEELDRQLDRLLAEPEGEEVPS